MPVSWSRLPTRGQLSYVSRNVLAHNCICCNASAHRTQASLVDTNFCGAKGSDLRCKSSRVQLDIVDCGCHAFAACFRSRYETRRSVHLLRGIDA